MYQALYRKYRPQTFDDVVGQSAVTQTLKNQLISGRLSHAYLFTGSRGTGKTSCAKILAKAVNCLQPENGNPCGRCAACRAIDSGACMDVLEIDAASNNGVDNVRDLRDDAVYTPAEVNKRVYIIDEVHMLSLSAFNALLKIIEEPPEHLLFILATTELHKVPATILSRCQRFSFRRIGQEDIAARLQYVAYQEGIDLDASGARVLARLADGALRDGLSLLDQCASSAVGEVNAEQVYACLGLAGERKSAELLGYVAEQNSRAALELFNRLYADGKDVAALLDEMGCLVRDLLILKTAPDAGIGMMSGVAEDRQAMALEKQFSNAELVRSMELIQQTLAGLSKSADLRLDAELCLLNLCQPQLRLDVQALNARLSRLEEQVKTGVRVAVQAEPEPVTEPKQTVPEKPAEPQCAEAPDEAPVGFWQDLASAVRAQLRPPISGFFMSSPNAPVQGVLHGNQVVLRCANPFTLEMVNRAEILRLVSEKASAQLGRQVAAVAVDQTAQPAANAHLDALLSFGRAHGDTIKIIEN